MRPLRTSSLFAAFVLAIPSARAQQPPELRLPEASPRASVSQTVGLTEMTVVYHRPAVAGRKVWGELVPFGEVWRAGANENTTLSLSSDVKVAGQPLAAGTYGVHVLPTAKDWTIIFSRMAAAWGSYSYDPKEDALRVTVTPQPAPFVERLAYSFDEPTEGSVTLALRWEKLAVAVPITVDTPKVVMANMRTELRGPARFSFRGWNRAAHYFADHGGDLDEALRFSDEALRQAKNFQVYEVRSRVLSRRGDARGAAAAREQAMSMATEEELNQYAYGLLLQERRVDDAIAMFQKNAKDHPKSWNAWDSLGEALAIKGDKKGATEAYEKALSLATDAKQKERIKGVLSHLGAK